MKEFLPYILPSIAILISLWVFYYQRKKDTSAELSIIKNCIAATDKNVSVVAERIAKVETSSELGWKMLELYAGKMLHHPTRPELDYYIDKNEKGELTKEEVKKFMSLLHRVIDSRTYTDGERTAATLLLAALARRFPELC